MSTTDGGELHAVRWNRVKELVAAALACPEEQRAELLKARCADDAALRREVESLLAGAARASGFLEGPPVAPMLRPDALSGQRIGRFEVLELIGRGGMGVVYRARQDAPRREVALKIVPGGAFVDDRRLRLFEREIASLGRLKHPGIAAIHEAGCTPDGQHYFALELVEGVPLDVYLSERRPSRQERLRLFLRICGAIHYAHQRAVIHRDIKPSNILVERAGIPKVLDFGLAKITESDVTLHSIATEPGRIQGTLAYMSPEQAAGRSEDIDVRSDVYSLGVVLFEMLTGRRPHDIAGASVPEAVRRICEEPPERMASIESTLRGDLETIVSKALSVTPNLRYESVAALAEDIDRCLTNQPILARPPSLTYQLGKLMRRHKLPAALLAILLLVVTTAAGVAAVLSIRLADERDVAMAAKDREAKARQAEEEVVQFLFGLWEGAVPGADPQSEPTLRDLVDVGVARVETELADKPLVQARMMTVLGRVRRLLGDYQQSVELLESALDIRRRRLGGEHLDLVECLVELNQALVRLGDHEQAYRLLQQVHDIRLAHFGEPSEAVSEALEFLGSNRFYARDNALAAEFFQRCLGMYQDLHGEDSLAVARARSNLGMTLRRLGRLDEAERLLRQSLGTRRRLLGNDAQVRLGLENLAHVLHARGDFEGAQRLLAEELQLTREAVHPNNPALAWVLTNYGVLVARNEGPEKAEPLYREALAIRRESQGDDHPEVAVALMRLGNLRHRLGDYDEARHMLAEALRIRRLRLGEEHGQVGASARDLGRTLQAIGRFAEAEPLLLESHRVFQQIHGARDRRAVRVGRMLIQLYEEWGRAEQAAVWKSRLADQTTSQPPDG